MYTFFTGFYCKYFEDAERIARKLNPVKYTVSESSSKTFPHYVSVDLPLYASEDAIQCCCETWDKILTETINQNKTVATRNPEDI